MAKPNKPQKSILDSFDGASYYGVLKEAMPEWHALSRAQDKHQYYPCLNNPYYYMDYDQSGAEVDLDEDKVYNELLSEDDVEALCFGCPILKQCYDFAVANEESYGVWGGIDFGRKEDQLF